MNVNDMCRRRKTNFSLFLLLFSTLPDLLLAQEDTIAFSFRKYGFEKIDENEIVNATTLSDFFERLYQLHNGVNGQVSIIQIGDSHIQADFLSSTIRQNLHRDFGNAGRGLIIPGRVAHTNEPSNISTSSNTNWEAKRVVFPEQTLSIGIGGITVQTLQPDSRMVIKTFNAPAPMDYRFKTLTFFFQKDFSSFNLALKDSIGHDLAYVGPYTLEQHPNISRVTLPITTNYITLQTLQSLTQQNQFTLFGISLENGKNGVLFHSIGVNGAKFKHYNVARYFTEQTKVLRPELFVISLGTNEAIDYPYLDPQFFNYIDQLVESLRMHNPAAKFILTVPPDHYRKKTRRNPGLNVIHDTIIRYAQQKNHAYWDLFSAGGGEHSADLYKKHNLIQRDGIHFTKEGYELQGNLFYAALIKAYNTYVSYRHP
jgi:lysophospholipase L1-like esterase